MAKTARVHGDSSDAVEAALVNAERVGFRFAMIGRTSAILVFTITALWGYYFPTNIMVAAFTAAVALIGLASLLAVGTRYERKARFAIFALDTVIISALLAFAPLSSGDAIPQNLVFLTSRVHNYYVIIAAALFTLSPRLVLWTGAWSVAGHAVATVWIMSGMDRVLSYADLPPAPSREVYFQTILDPSFLGTATRFQEGLIIGIVAIVGALAVRRARRVVRAHASAEEGRRRAHDLFGRYVPAPVVQQLLDEGYLDPQTREATLLFADIEGFTRLTQDMPAEKLVSVLNDFFSAVSAVIDQNGGVVINYIGDAIIASFNAPLPREDYAARAIRASRAILTMVEERRFEGVKIKLRIGIATGQVAAGSVGSGERQTYTLYGDAVNLSQRLEALNKETETRCLICGNTVGKAESLRPHLVSLGIRSIRSRQGDIEVFKHDNEYG
ncbi:adenylate/guanylate cyclase domain-containing protein [Rhizobium laguerreae]|uniref:adenylate/guanylate cyclase domain-containing protein n=1 Tax=Rhizobium laguerreae TaxID=1076926 RepID=UPI001C924FB7|nr:adenylate/guanylate cyclase domain-containing protein [Rhizobium laguerreae]MBY3217700.1 adenylate/guanylate cyclase domain-containing protein [Rhizobium laguerreae]